MLGTQVVAAYRVGAFEPALRLERVHPDMAEREDWETGLTLGGIWHLHPRLELKANFISDFAPGTSGREVLVQAQAAF
jgi:hypothetical protein